MDNWYRIKDKEPEVTTEVLVFNKHWIDPDFNPDGICMGFLMDDKSFCVGIWNPEYDFWDNINIDIKSPHYPTHWQPKPTPPKD